MGSERDLLPIESPNPEFAAAIDNEVILGGTKWTITYLFREF